MPFFDLPLEQLRTYQPDRHEPADFDAFWQQTLTKARQFPLAAEFTPYQDIPFSVLDVFDVSFRGFGGHLIKAWLLLPRQRAEPLPCVVEYIGYGGGRGYPLEWLHWSPLGYAHLIMDNRGQGSTWGPRGDTPDPGLGSGQPHYPGFLTRGIEDPHHHYYRRLFTDATRAVEAARAHPAVDPERIFVTGGSQGGGIALAVAGLAPGLTAVLPDVPFLCHYRVASEITAADPYGELGRYCRFHRTDIDAIFATLAYFDGVNFAARASAPALFSVGLMDEICPPRTVFAAYNHYQGEKDICIWAYNHHEGGGVYHQMEKIKFIQKHL